MSRGRGSKETEIVPGTLSAKEYRLAVASKDTSPLDPTDRAIVRVLQRNGRTSNTEIGRALGLTETTIRKRIARLVDEGLVNVVAVPTPEAVGTTL
jgi:Lrp/AsnC family transcriptional regulator, regulator for asnA, asnC and gidA